MALPLVLYDFTATVAKSPANRRPSHRLRVASGPGLSVRAHAQTSSVRGSVGSLKMVVLRCADLQQSQGARLAPGHVGKFRLTSRRVGRIRTDKPPILQQLGVAGEGWLKLVASFHTNRGGLRRAIGRPAALEAEAIKRGGKTEIVPSTPRMCGLLDVWAAEGTKGRVCRVLTEREDNASRIVCDAFKRAGVVGSAHSLRRQSARVWSAKPTAPDLMNLFRNT